MLWFVQSCLFYEFFSCLPGPNSTEAEAIIIVANSKLLRLICQFVLLMYISPKRQREPGTGWLDFYIEDSVKVFLTAAPRASVGQEHTTWVTPQSKSLTEMARLFTWGHWWLHHQPITPTFNFLMTSAMLKKLVPSTGDNWLLVLYPFTDYWG